MDDTEWKENRLTNNYDDRGDEKRTKTEMVFCDPVLHHK